MRKPRFDSFISYASEDEDFASTLASELQAAGFSIWFAPLNLTVGDKLLDSINVGLNLSETGLVILSPHYIRKKWTSYELDVLHRQHIESEKRLLPIWHGVDKKALDQRNPGLAGIIGLSTSKGLPTILPKIFDRLSHGARFRGVAPSWEDPFHRFLSAQGELNANRESGPTFNLFEAFLLDEGNFPIFIDGKNYSRDDLAYHVTMALAHKSYHQNMRPLPDVEKKLVRMCKKCGYDPKHFE